jgi:predicted lipoprotein
VNTFPCDPAKINANISSGTYNLDAIGNLDAKGLPGMDYLLFGAGTDNAAILALYTTDAQAANRKAYLSDLSAAVKSVAGSVLHSWIPGGGNYINTFVTATGTDVGSSLGQLINQVDFDIDLLKNYRLGVPLGKQSMGVLYPTKVEAYYSGISSELAVLQLQSLQNIYLGASGLGLDDYLAEINAQYNGGSLDAAIQAQFLSAITHMQAVPDPFSAEVAANSPAANSAYTEVQKLLVLMKTDMPSSLGVLITYEDTDGD